MPLPALRASLRAAFLTALLAFPCAALAQRPAAPANAPPPRYLLADTADPNDWKSYYNAGVRMAQNASLSMAMSGDSVRLAGDAFSWAARLDPSRAEPMQGKWVTFWLGHQGLFLWGDRSALRRPEVLANDSLRWRATLRNPFYSRNLDILVFARVAPFVRGTPWMRALLEYTDGDYREAARVAGRALRSDKKQVMDLREVRQLSFAAANQLDSATAETQRMLDYARSRDEKDEVLLYEGKELLQYELGILAAARGDLRGAREVLANALVEDMSFYPAHMALADVAIATGDTATALAEYAQAVTLAPDDPLVHFRYGGLLLHTASYADAAAQLKLASTAEPWWPEASLNLGVALEAAGDGPGALAAYKAFIAHAPRRLSESVSRIQERAAALSPPADGTAATPPAT